MVEIVDEMGVPNQDIKNLIFYPNPTNDYLNIESTEIINNIETFNFIGQKVETVNPDSKKVRMNVKKLEAGIYILRIQSNGISKMYRFIKR